MKPWSSTISSTNLRSCGYTIYYYYWFDLHCCGLFWYELYYRWKEGGYSGCFYLCFTFLFWSHGYCRFHPLNQSYNISHFIFCSTINPHIVDLRVPDTVYTFELSLCLPLPLGTLPTDIVATKPLCSSHIWHTLMLQSIRFPILDCYSCRFEITVLQILCELVFNMYSYIWDMYDTVQYIYLFGYYIQ